jgi:hypothetical protein
MNFIKLVTSALLLAACTAALMAGSARNESGKDQPLIAALSVREETQCVDTKSREIEANLAFTNTSATDIILQRGLGQKVTVLGLFGTKTLSPLLRSWSSASDAGPRSTATEITIRPGNTFAYSVHLRLDAEVLKQPGFYKVQLSYDVTKPDSTIGRTNWAIIQVRECDASAALHDSDTVDAATGNLGMTIPVVATTTKPRH